ncbi:acetyl-coenzyme A synthetase N-terminal domain-containing protein, partial [Celeribacter persicus]
MPLPKRRGSALGGAIMTDIYPPSETFASDALISTADYEDLYRRSVEDPVSFWAEQGKVLDWMEPYT